MLNDGKFSTFLRVGLLGLAGLLGLMPRKKHEVHVRETHDVRDRNTTGGDRR